METWTVFLSTLTQDASKLTSYQAIKRSSSAEVFRATLIWGTESLEVVCKIRRVESLAKKIRTQLGLGTQARQFRLAQALATRHIPTAQPLAYGSCAGSSARTLLITAYLGDTLDLDRLALVELPQKNLRDAYRIKHALVRSLATLTSQMREAGISHRDFKASNILVSGISSPRNLKTWLVDLEGVSVGRRPITSANQWTPTIRLAASLIAYSSITKSDYARFLKTYLSGNNKDAGQWKTWFIELADQVAQYNRKAQARKNHKLDGYSG